MFRPTKSMRSKDEKTHSRTAVLLGVGASVNGVFMLALPADWYFVVPGVTTIGPSISISSAISASSSSLSERRF
jgi:hypothetical protein